jgi:hypothetical protein
MLLEKSLRVVTNTQGDKPHTDIDTDTSKDMSGESGEGVQSMEARPSYEIVKLTPQAVKDDDTEDKAVENKAGEGDSAESAASGSNDEQGEKRISFGKKITQGDLDNELAAALGETSEKGDGTNIPYSRYVNIVFFAVIALILVVQLLASDAEDGRDQNSLVAEDSQDAEGAEGGFLVEALDASGENASNPQGGNPQSDGGQAQAIPPTKAEPPADPLEAMLSGTSAPKGSEIQNEVKNSEQNTSQKKDDLLSILNSKE